MSLVVDDQESGPNIPVIDLEKEVFDLDAYNYNQIFVTSNVVLVFQALQLTLPVVKIWPLNSRQPGETSLEMYMT